MSSQGLTWGFWTGGLGGLGGTGGEVGAEDRLNQSWGKWVEIEGGREGQRATLS